MAESEKQEEEEEKSYTEGVRGPNVFREENFSGAGAVEFLNGEFVINTSGETTGATHDLKKIDAVREALAIMPFKLWAHAGASSGDQAFARNPQFPQSKKLLPAISD